MADIEVRIDKIVKPNSTICLEFQSLESQEFQVCDLEYFGIQFFVYVNIYEYYQNLFDLFTKK